MMDVKGPFPKKMVKVGGGVGAVGRLWVEWAGCGRQFTLMCVCHMSISVKAAAGAQHVLQCWTCPLLATSAMPRFAKHVVGACSPPCPSPFPLHHRSEPSLRSSTLRATQT